MHLDSHRQLEFYWGLADPSRQLEEPRNMKVIAGFKCYIAVTSSLHSLSWSPLTSWSLSFTKDFRI